MYQLLAHIMDCTVVMGTKTQFSRDLAVLKYPGEGGGGGEWWSFTLISISINMKYVKP